MSTYVKPTAASVQELLQTLFGDETAVSAAEPPDSGASHVATFVSDTDSLVAAFICDAKFVAYSGAAFSMLPAAIATDMAASSNFSDVVKANFHEVMNICSRLLTSDQSAHLRLDKTLAPQDGAGAVAELESGGSITGFQIDIPGYGAGLVAALIT